MRTEPELRERLKSLQEKEKTFLGVGMPHTSNRLITRAHIYEVLYALGEEKGYKVI